MAEVPRKYCPSNGSEGDWFISKFCENCIHGKYEHTRELADNPCEILTASFVFNVTDKEFPSEWIYLDDKPTCTAWKKWDWGRDDDGNFINPDVPVIDPNQLSLNLLLEEVEQTMLEEVRDNTETINGR